MVSEIELLLGVKLKPELELDVRLVDDGEKAIVFEQRRRLERALLEMIVPKLTVFEDRPEVPTPVPEALESVLDRVLELDMVMAIGVVDTAAPELPEPLDMVLVGELMLETTVVIEGVDVPILPLQAPTREVPVT